MDAPSLLQFIENYFNGNLKPLVKSEKLPVSNSQPLKKVVRDNFNEIVLDNDSDVLLMVHTPWCQHCQGEVFETWQ